MKPETGDTGPDPWSVEAGRYEVEVASTWSILQQEGDPVPKAPAITLTRYVYLTVAKDVYKRQLPEQMSSMRSSTIRKATGKVGTWASLGMC